MKKGYKVGYGRPPKEHQFQKGKSGNPRGRPKKLDRDDTTMAAILKRVGEQEIRVAGKSRTLMEVEILALQAQAAKGNIAASRHLARLRKEAGLLAPMPPQAGGVLVVPGTMDLARWSAAAALQQAQFRGDSPDVNNEE